MGYDSRFMYPINPRVLLHSSITGRGHCLNSVSIPSRITSKERVRYPIFSGILTAISSLAQRSRAAAGFVSLCRRRMIFVMRKSSAPPCPLGSRSLAVNCTKRKYVYVSRCWIRYDDIRLTLALMRFAWNPLCHIIVYITQRRSS